MAEADTDKRPDAPDRPRSPFSSTWWIVSAVVVALITAMFLYLIVQPAYHRPGPPPAAAPPPAVAAAGSVCGLTGGDQTIPTVPPTPAPGPDFAWMLNGTMAVPSDPVHGPGTTATVTVPGAAGASTVKVPVCYSPDPWGAVYAAYNFVAATTTPALRWAAADHLTAPGPGRDAALADLDTGGPGSRSTGFQIAGFHVADYSPAASATIDVAITNGANGWAWLEMALVWSAGDWLVQLPVTGTYTVRPLPTLAEYVPFQGA